MQLPVASHVLNRFCHFHQFGWEWRETCCVSKVEFVASNKMKIQEKIGGYVKFSFDQRIEVCASQQIHLH